jgi:hypothetical protein
MKMYPLYHKASAMAASKQAGIDISAPRAQVRAVPSRARLPALPCGVMSRLLVTAARGRAPCAHAAAFSRLRQPFSFLR